MRKLGYRRDPTNLHRKTPDRDASIKLRSAPVPASSDNQRLFVSILDQGNLGSCVENGTFQAIRGSHVKQGVQNPVLGSRLWAYWFARAYTHETDQDSGSFVYNCFDAINKFGFPPEPLWPYSDDDHTFTIMPSMAAVDAAYDQRAMGPVEYLRISTTGRDRIDDIKRALGAGYLVVFGTSVSEQFTSVEPGNKPIDPPIGLPIAGGHCLVAADHQGDDFRICNSWSENWNKGGFCHFSADYMAWSESDDFWIVEAAPLYSDPQYAARRKAAPIPGATS